jgi:DUF4097 and DUF4098 domain-containing protein YvlB
MNRLGLLLASAVFTSAAFGAPSPTISTSETGTEEVLKHHVSMAPGGMLTVSVDFGSIEVTTNATNEVLIDAFRRVSMSTRKKEADFLEERPIRIEETPTGVKITARKKGTTGASWNWNFGRAKKMEGRYRISVPSHFNVVLDTAGGPISVSDLTGSVRSDTSGGGLKFFRIDGPIHGDTSGGPIAVTDSRGEIHIETSGGGIDVAGGGGDLKADTSGGPISVRNFKGPAEVETSGGGITLENVGGKVSGSTSGGSIHVQLPAPIQGDVDLESSGGGIILRTAADAGFKLDAETSGGGVSSELPVTVIGRRESNELKGDVNGGGDRTVRLRTSGGGIRVKKVS